LHDFIKNEKLDFGHNNHPYIKDYLRRNYILEEDNPYGPAFNNIIFENRDTLDSDSILACSDPRLTEMIINMQINTDDEWSSLSSNSNPLLTELLLKCGEYLDPHALMYNCNEGLAELIIDLLSKLFHYEEDFYKTIASVENAGVGSFILEHIDRMDINIIARNPNPALTKYLLDHIDNMQWHDILHNSNPALTEIIIGNPDKINLASMLFNKNPKIAEFVIKNKHKIDPKHYYLLGHNRYIFKRVPIKLL
jgi:hypothetical protein